MDNFVKTTLGAGCFWCIEAVLLRLEGVHEVVPGYAGGHDPDPTYRSVCAGTTGHAEVARVSFDPAVLSFEDLLEVFFTTHDPTTKDRQGADVGTQYRSIILAENDDQLQRAVVVRDRLQSEGLFTRPIVTELERLDTFYTAEDYHHQYYDRNPYQPYCMAVISPKVAKLRAKYADRLKKEAL